MRLCASRQTQLIGVRLGAWQTLAEEGDLAGVMRDMFADVEPFPMNIHFHFSELLGFARLQPGIIALLEFSERLFASLAENVGVVLKVVAFDLLAAGVAEVHGCVPLLLDVVGPAIPLLIVEGVHLIVGLGGCDVKNEGADGIGVLVKESIQLRLSKPFDEAIQRALHVREHRNHGADLGAVPRAWADDEKIVVWRYLGIVGVSGWRERRHAGESGGCESCEKEAAAGREKDG